MTIVDLYKLFRTSTGISTDTRSIKEGNIYFALKGDNFDGNRFVDLAFEKGATHAVIDNSDYARKETILVEDVLETLQTLSSYHRDQLKIPVIGLTGSNGKTTTKELIAAALNIKYKTAFTKGNLNNHIGVPLTLLTITGVHEMAVIEMGANHKKEIEFLCSLCKPTHGYITNFGKAHLEGFGGMDGVISAKTELYQYLRAHEGTVFLNQDDPLQLERSNGIQSVTFGQSQGGDYQIKPATDTANTENMNVAFNGQIIRSRLTGNYNFSNISAAIAIASHFGVPPKEIADSLQNYIPSNNRSQITNTGNNTLILDTYNANPSSMEAAILNFAQFPADEKWAILGDMFELGDHEAAEHQRIADLVFQQGFEKVILVGNAFSKCNTPDEVIPDTQSLTKRLKENPVKGKTILLKGSRGMAMEKALPLL